MVEHSNREGKVLPLVSILIPTHNRPDFLKIALDSALAQTYKNIEIIVSDNSTNTNSKTMIEKYKYLEKFSNIKYIYHGRDLGAHGGGNMDFIIQQSRGEYINFLMDDDFFHPNKIEKMMQYFLSIEDCVLVTSKRKLVDIAGRKLPDIAATRRLYSEDTILNGDQLGQELLTRFLNFIGEPTTVLFKKSQLDHKKPFLGYYLGGKVSKGNGDIATWLEILHKGKAVYISEELSCFRLHGGQNQRKWIFSIYCLIDYNNFIHDFYKSGFYIHSYEAYLCLLNNWLKKFPHHKLFHETSAINDEEKRYHTQYCDCVKRNIEILQDGGIINKQLSVSKVLWRYNFRRNFMKVTKWREIFPKVMFKMRSKIKP